MKAATFHVNDQLHYDDAGKKKGKKTVSWRKDGDLFHSWTKDKLSPGVVNLSPGWHSQGHEVSNFGGPMCSHKYMVLIREDTIIFMYLPVSEISTRKQEMHGSAIYRSHLQSFLG